MGRRGPGVDGAALTRRGVLALGACAAAAGFAGLAGCAPAPPLRVAVQPWCGYQFLVLAEREGWLPAGTVELLPTRSTRESVEAFALGQADAAALTLDEALLLAARGIDLAVVLMFDISAGADVLLARPGIGGIEALAGKRIGVEDSALGAIVLAGVAEAAGLDPSALDVVPIGEDHFAAWQTGTLDAVLSYEPSLGRLRSLGLVPLFDSRNLPRLVIDVLAVRQDAARTRAAAVRALVAGHFRALSAWRSNPIDTSYRLAPRLGVSAEEVRGVLAGLELPDRLYNLRYLSPPADELRAASASIVRILAAAGRMPDWQVPPSLFVPDFLGGAGG